MWIYFKNQADWCWKHCQIFFTVLASECAPPSPFPHYLAESEERERRRKERERESEGWVGPLFFLPIQSWPQAGAYSAVTPPLSSPSPPLSPSTSPKNLSLNLLSLYMAHLWIYPPFFSHYRFHFLCSKPYGRWHPLAPPCAPSFPPNPPLLLHPHFFSHVRHRNRIYKSQLSTAHSPKKRSSKLLQAALQLFSGLRCLRPSVRQKKSLKSKTHTQAGGQTKESERKEIRTGLVGFFEGRNTERGCQFSRNFGVYSKESPVLILNPTLAGSLTLWLLEKTCTSFETWHLPSQKQPSVSHRGLKDKQIEPLAPLPRCTWTHCPNTHWLRC